MVAANEGPGQIRVQSMDGLLLHEMVHDNLSEGVILSLTFPNRMYLLEVSLRDVSYQESVMLRF